MKSPDVRFRLQVWAGDRAWKFEIRLLSKTILELPVERYAWVCLGKPEIPRIGDDFVHEIGRNHCIARFLEFLRRHQGLSENTVEPMDFKLRKHLQLIYADDWEEARNTFDLIPKTIQNVIFYRTYQLVNERLKKSCDSCQN